MIKTAHGLDLPAISQQIWEQKYRFDNEPSIEATWERVSDALAQAEKPEDRSHHFHDFYWAMEGFKFIPAGRILAGAGTGRDVTLFNCLSGDTPILTLEYGLVPIARVAGEVVSVLDGNGHWAPSPVFEHGEQEVTTVTLRGGYNGRVSREVRATLGHRWKLASGEWKTTEELWSGDVLAFADIAAGRKTGFSVEYMQGVRHGVVYGDGTQRPAGHATIRLCGEKAALAKFFVCIGSPWDRISDQDGDPVFYLPTHAGKSMRLKELPTGMSPDYLCGFVRGWFATDGCVSRSQPILSCGLSEMDWLRQYGPIASFEVSSFSQLSDETNFGPRHKALFNVRFHRTLLDKGDFILDKHRAAFEPMECRWVVDSVSGSSVEPVYCPQVPTTASFRLALGIHTGNCFVMGTIPDSMDGIFEAVKEASLTMQQGGGVGMDFSTIRPKGFTVKGVGAEASGPLSFMDVWDSACRTIMSAGTRRGAMMATMRCDHPDVEAFIEAKRDPQRFRMFNLSVLVTDAFMGAVEHDHAWNLNWHGKVTKSISARELWDKIMKATYDVAEPGVIFIDRINDDNNLNYCETIAATNPCGEQPLPPYGACLLGSINLTAFVLDPFTSCARIDYETLGKVTRIAVRMLDNVIDVSKYPLPQQEKEAKEKRRLGLGVTGLADAMIMLGLHYGSPVSTVLVEDVLAAIEAVAYNASSLLAKEKGVFPLYRDDKYIDSRRFNKLPAAVRADIEDYGLRNSHLTSIAPTGTISLLAGNVSSGIEPVFSQSYTRKVLQADGSRREETVRSYSLELYRAKYARDPGDAETQFVDAQSLKPEDHLRIQSTAQAFIDSSISKTINLPEDISFEDFKSVYRTAYDTGCKGCTTYRPNDVTGSVLSIDPPAATAENIQAQIEHGVFLGPKFEGRIEIKNGLISEGTMDGPQYTYKVDEVHYTQGPVTEGPYPNAPIEVLPDRPQQLSGKTYKLRWGDHALYITINDVVEDGVPRPFEIFINSKNMEHYGWTVALTRMISAVFRRGGDVSFVAEELKSVFEPAGGQWMDGHYVPSLLAAIGDIVERHLLELEVDEGPEDIDQPPAKSPPPGYTAAPARGASCPKCHQPQLIHQGGCEQCLSCGYSKCS